MVKFRSSEERKAFFAKLARGVTMQPTAKQKTSAYCPRCQTLKLHTLHEEVSPKAKTCDSCGKGGYLAW